MHPGLTRPRKDSKLCIQSMSSGHFGCITYHQHYLLHDDDALTSLGACAAVVLGAAFSFWMFRQKNDDDDIVTKA